MVKGTDGNEYELKCECTSKWIVGVDVLGRRTNRSFLSCPKCEVCGYNKWYEFDHLVTMEEAEEIIFGKKKEGR